MGKDDGGLRALFRKHLPDFFWTTVESGAISPAVPDSHWKAPVGPQSGWIEYKKTDTNRIASLDPRQAAWLDRYWRLGGISHLAVRFRHGGGPRKGPPVDDLWIVPGCRAIDVLRNGIFVLTEVSEDRGAGGFRTSGGHSRWEWDRVRAAVLGRRLF